MKPINDLPETFKVELTRKEVEFIRLITQNPTHSHDEEVRRELFVGASRLLGYDMNSDGTIKCAAPGPE